MDDTAFNEEANVISIDIGGGTTKLALINRRGDVQGWQSFPTAGESGVLFIGAVVRACRELQARSNGPVEGVAAAVAGFVSADGVLDYNPNLPWLEKTPIAEILAKELGLPVHADADSNAACLAEYLSEGGRGSSRFLCLTGGTGLGVGMVAEGKLLRIAHGCMGDAGHVIVSPEGPECSCGGRGCAEALLSTAALGSRYAEARGVEGKSFRALVVDARNGVSGAVALLEEAGYWLGISAASLANVFLPDRIAIAGGLSHAGDGFFGAAESSFRDHAGKLPLSLASLVRASTGEHATLLGAAAGFFNPELR
jgi:glucokinase